MNSGTLFAYLVTFTASFCMMVIELVAGRILAPYIGQHLYSWTSIIGVCLAGISIGAWLGGWLADKLPYRSTLGWFLLFAGLFSLAIPLLTDQICTAELLKGKVSLMVRIVAYTALIFLPATLVLGMISPMVIKLVVRDLNKTGSIVGRIYAFSTIGSILGTFVTGFFLIEMFGTRVLLYAVGVLLIVIAPLAGGIFYSGTKYVGGALVGLLLAAVTACFLFPDDFNKHRDALVDYVGKPRTIQFPSQNPEDPKSFWSRLLDSIHIHHKDVTYLHESNYYTLRVSEHEHTDKDTQEARMLNYLVLDNLVHSHSDMSDPTYLAYEYLCIYEELVGWQLKNKGSTKHRELFVGGGGYTLQRYFHHLYKDCHIDVAEIDPKVTYVAEKYMGAPKNDPRLVTSNEDGRMYVLDKQGTKDKYEFIFGDAFNDLSVPFHLTTVEFDKQLKNLLTPNGLVMSLVIDHVSEGKFLPSFIATMRQAFGDENVVLILIANPNEKKKLLEYLKEKKLDQYIAALSEKPLEEVTKEWDAKKYAAEIEYLKNHKLNDFAPYLKANDLDYFTGHDTVIVVGSATPQNWDDFEKYLADMNAQYVKDKSAKQTVSNVIRPAVLTEYLKTRTREPNLWEKMTKGNKPFPWAPIVLSDDYAPVDNLLAPLFEKRFGYKKPTKDGKNQDEDRFVDELLKDNK
ncbi:MAG TPA: fused MFS/spermidine synthase [Gemmatales bacterium]|nr:fused MFS/spermidine synthase [Gemmatales bacterium]